MTVEYLIMNLPLIVNIAHVLVYLHLRPRAALRALLAFALIVPVWPVIWQVAGKGGVLAILAGPAFLIYDMLIFRRLLTSDGYKRIFFVMAAVMAFNHLVRLPIFMMLVYCLRLPIDDCIWFNHLIFAGLFVVALPLLVRFVREPFLRILDVAENQKWYVVAAPPLCFSILGASVTNMIVSAADVPGIFLVGLFMPISIGAYFASMYSFLINKNARLVFQQRLAAAEQLEHTYAFYGRELAGQESRLRALRHDFRHLVAHLDILARERDFDGILREIHAVSSVGDGVAIAPFCENHTVNAIVSFHFTHAEKSGVNCVAKAFVPEKLAMPEAELALLLGNALENCVKGAGTLGERGYITFDAKPAKGYMMFVFANNYDRGKYAGGEGAGLASIRHICEKYEGWMETSDENNEYRLTLFLRVL